MIKIVRGVYGFMDENGIVRPKTAADEPFALLPEQEARLVRQGVAQYVETVKDEQEPEQSDPEQVETEDEQEPIGFDETPVDEPALSELSVKELREIGKGYGLSFKVGTSKGDMVKAIEAAEAEMDAEGEDDGEPAPAFDASEAVL
jgi:hypothetical protein